jgi:murein DD-endopeptidase MepM/ murein hydrolase activator NlpD
MHKLFLPILTLSLLWSCKNSTDNQQSSNNNDESTVATLAATPVDTFHAEFGIPASLEPYIIDTGIIQKNQILSDVLDEYAIPYSTVYQMVENAKGLFDIRKIRAGNPYYIYSQQTDSNIEAKYFVYKDQSFKYIVFNLQDSFGVYSFQKQIDTVLRRVSGSINKTLYHTIIDIKAPFELGEKLSQVYAWQVDFFHIQKNDGFTVLFEELMVDGESIGVGQVLASWFKHHIDTFEDYFYAKEGYENYYDEQGKSLRKAFLKAPLKYSRISSKFSRRRFHPVQKRWKAHLGTDYAAPHGTPILAVGDGTVIAAAYTRGNGRYVKIKHNSTFTTQYLHMSRYGKGIRNGVRVKQGQVIGYVGATGLATGPHLCYRFWMNGKQTDPFRVKIPPSKSIEKEEKEPYLETMRALRAQLEKEA